MLYMWNIIAAISVSLAVSGMLLCIIESRRKLRINEMKCSVMRKQLREIKDSAERLQETYMMDEKLYKAKSRFMNRMSHDLRTPLNAILGYSILISRNPDDEDTVNRYARRIYISGHTLLELINDVLDMGCIESGKLKLVEHEFSLKSAFEEVKASVKPQADAKCQSFNVYVTYNSDKDLIIGDKQRFCQILRNILSNAVKYTGNGGSVDLTANIIETGPEELQLTYVVKDNGCGMSDEFAERLFQPFQREENELNTSTPGTGLGMCIACSFAELMNGSITVESKLGTGTSVMVKLPLKAVIKNDDSNHIVLNSSNELHGLHFLAAEDNESNAEILKEVLAAMGAECTMTENGQAAVDVFLKSAPGTYDAVLMDIQMPVMDGYKAAKAIRSCKHPDAEEVVIIAMTADAFEEDVQRAFVSGMNAHVAKPLNIQSFIGTIKTLGLN